MVSALALTALLEVTAPAPIGAAPPPAVAAPPADRAAAPGAARPARRPRFDVAIGIGRTYNDQPRYDQPPLDPADLQQGRRTLLAYVFMATLGADGVFGLSLRSFSNEPAFGEAARLSAELVLVGRPLAWWQREDTRWAPRVVRSFALTAGPALEQITFAMRGDWRRGVALGAHLDVPVTPGDRRSELRLRLGARRLLGPDRSFPMRTFGDTSGELWGALTLVF
jgi:hypothetical protein